MADIIYRKATTADLPILLEFEQAIISFERDFDINLKKPCVYYDFDALYQSPNTEIIVAQHNKKLVGSGYAKIVDAQPYHINKTYAYMGFMFIDPKYRGQGIIQNIIEILKNWAKTKNVVEARLLVYDANVGAIKAYEKSGFDRHMLEMKLYFD